MFYYRAVILYCSISKRKQRLLAPECSMCKNAAIVFNCTAYFHGTAATHTELSKQFHLQGKLLSISNCYIFQM